MDSDWPLDAAELLMVVPGTRDNEKAIHKQLRVLEKERGLKSSGQTEFFDDRLLSDARGLMRAIVPAVDPPAASMDGAPKAAAPQPAAPKPTALELAACARVSCQISTTFEHWLCSSGALIVL